MASIFSPKSNEYNCELPLSVLDNNNDDDNEEFDAESKAEKNILDTRKNKNEGGLDTGVKKLVILALCYNIQENHHNLRVMIELINLNELKFVLAADLKLINVVLGLSVIYLLSLLLFIHTTFLISLIK